ncbi:SDR family oxidoreductase [Hydrogenoanaerobacterium sp.]|nr:SDR family oxidoreductase [Hydrogenoanaerobacterium sp.]
MALEMLQGRVGNSYDITRAAMLLCRRNSGFISGESITVDGGMTRPMI